MYCKHCGKQIADDARFCDSCGKPVADEVNAHIADEEKPRKKKKKNHPILGTILLLFSIFLIIGSIGNNSAPTEPEISKEDYMQLCREISYEDLARNPDSYKGEYFKFIGEVIQVMESGNKVTLRVNVTANTLFETTYYSDTIYVVATLPENGDRILTQDIIEIYGVCQGLYTYMTVLGSEMSIPRIDAGYWNIV